MARLGSSGVTWSAQQHEGSQHGPYRKSRDIPRAGARDPAGSEAGGVVEYTLRWGSGAMPDDHCALNHSGQPFRKEVPT